jgi:lipopolysaccharide transport system permease protein
MNIAKRRATDSISRPTRRLIYLRDVLWELVVRDMKLRYKRSLAGIVWTLLNPLAQLSVISFVFTVIFPLHLPNYISSTFMGIIAWNWFQASLYSVTGAIVDNRELIRRPHFPIMMLPIVTITTNLIHFILSLPVLMVLLLLQGIPPALAMIALPLVMALQYALTLGIGYLVATLNVKFRDTSYLLGVILLLGFFMTPIWYDFASVPAAYQPLYLLNPMVSLLRAYRAILIQGQWPDAVSLLAVGLLAAVLLVIGYRYFRKATYWFAEEL